MSKQSEFDEKLMKFTDEVWSRLEDSYTLVWVDHDHSLTEEQVEAMLDAPADVSIWEYADFDRLWEWESDVRQVASQEEAARIVREVAEEMFDSPEDEEILEEFEYGARDRTLDELEETIRDRDNSAWFDEVVGNTRAPLMRTMVSEWGGIGEGHYYEDIESLQKNLVSLLEELGIDAEANSEAVNGLVANAGSGWRDAYWVFTPEDLSLILNAHENDVFEVHDPTLWLTNPYAGDGWEEEIKGVVRLKRSDLSTDKSAGGYSFQEVFGVYPSSYETHIEKV